MLLVPRQLRRAGMTGNVPYYGGRFTPAQAYAASHPSAPPLGPVSSMPGRPGRTDERPPVHAAPGPAEARADTLAALTHLLDTGVVTPEEYEDLRARVEE